MITLDKRGRRIIVDGDEPVTGIKNAIPGAYQTTRGYWTVPCDMETCRLLRALFGKRLVLSNELRRWANGEVSRRKTMHQLATATTARLTVLPHVAPKLYAAMKQRPYQSTGARYIADNNATLIADDPGLGKTLMAMAGILEAECPGPYLVVAPKTAADSVWRREINRWLPRPHRAVILPELRSGRERLLRVTRYTPHTWMIVHPEILMIQEWLTCEECGKRTPMHYKQQREMPCGHAKTPKTPRDMVYNYPILFSQQWGAVIVDESHESLIRRTGKPTQRRRGLDSLNVRPDGIRLAMSGTPFDSKPHQLWGTLNWLNPTKFSAFHRWAALYWRKGGYTGFELGEFIKEREPLLWDSLSDVALRRTKSEVAKDLPPKAYVGTPYTDDPASPVGIWLPMSGKQQRAYDAMEALSVAQLDSGRLEAITALAELTRLKQLACAYGDIIPETKNTPDGPMQTFRYIPKLPSNKFEWVVQHLEEWGYPDDPLDKVVIVSFYTGILSMFSAEIERHFRTAKRRKQPLCAAITGRTPARDRRSVIDAFNDPSRSSPQVLMLNVKAGGTAITLDTASRMIFISETRIPDQQVQAEDRIHRVSNPRHCEYYYLRTLGTVDVGTALVNQQALHDTQRLLDVRRGVQYTRHVISSSHTRG